MFRSRRSGLVKRLWKARITLQNEAQCPPESASQELELKSALNSLLKRLKETQLEALVASIESEGVEKVGCVLVPQINIHLSHTQPEQSMAPHMLACRAWRWPDLRATGAPPNMGLKQLTCCNASPLDPLVCANPYHWSQVLEPGETSVPYKL